MSGWLVLLALVSVLGVGGCSDDKEKPGNGKVTAAATGGDCARCSKERKALASKLKASQNQVRKLKRQIKALKKRK